MSTSINFDKNYAEALSENQDEITQADEDQFQDISSIDKKEAEDGMIKKTLKKISLGQYKTPLYFRKKESFSSVTGGAITLICGILFLTYAISLLVQVFTQDQMNLQVKSQNLQYYYYN